MCLTCLEYPCGGRDTPHYVNLGLVVKNLEFWRFLGVKIGKKIMFRVQGDRSLREGSILFVVAWARIDSCQGDRSLFVQFEGRIDPTC